MSKRHRKEIDTGRPVSILLPPPSFQKLPGGRGARLQACSMAAHASAAGVEPGENLPSFPLYLAVEQSRNERRVGLLMRRLAYLRSSTDAVAAELEAMKRPRQGVEQELVSSAASIHQLEERMSRLQEDLLKMSSDWDALKSISDADRDKFISQMDEINANMGQLFQRMVSVKRTENSRSGLLPHGQHLEGEYRKDLLNHDKAPNLHPKKEIPKADIDDELKFLTRDFQKTVSVTLTDNNHSGSSLTIGQYISENHGVLESEDLLKDLVDKAQMHPEEISKNKGYTERYELASNSSDSDSDSDPSDGEFFSCTSSLPHPSSSIKEQRLQFAALLSKSRIKKQFCSPPSDASVPPLPAIELVQSSRRDSSSSSSSSGGGSSGSSSNGGYLIRDDLDEIDAVGCGYPLASWVGLATDAEEEELLMEVAVRVADDPEARQIILNHHGGNFVSDATPIEVIMDFLIVLLGKEKDSPSCRVCMSDFKVRDRCVCLRCYHIFHMKCILEWLLMKKTCPVCRGDVSIVL